MQAQAFFVETPVILAPMAGYTDASFRLLCRECGASATVTEMVSVKGLLYGGKSARLLDNAPGERPVIAQLFGREPALMAEAVKRLTDARGETLAGFDINMGCPAPKITGNGEGSALMREPALAGALLEAAAHATRLPVSAKLRKGWDAEHANAVELARILEDSGASFLTVHGRTRDQMYAGKADWETVAAVKRAVRIPVLGNGDVLSGADAVQRLRETGCDGLMVGRGALGNPWIFSEIRAAFSGTPYTPPTEDERMRMAARHARLVVADKGEHGAVELRKHVVWYVRNRPDAAKLRARLHACTSLSELLDVLCGLETGTETGERPAT